MTWIIVGRVIQGMGAVSSAVIAFIADLTAEEHRTKAMAMVGGSIGMSFAVAIVGAPIVFHWVGMSGLFTLVGVFSILAVGVVLWVVPDAPKPVHVQGAVRRSAAQRRAAAPEFRRARFARHSNGIVPRGAAHSRKRAARRSRRTGRCICRSWDCRS